MAHTTIVSTEELASHLGDPDWVVVDVRSDLLDPSAGRMAYSESHIAGAVFADINVDLAGEPGGGRGRHPLPSPDEFAERAGALGIDRSVQVVAYDAADGMYASRLWWMLRSLGHEAVAVLDGGLAKWVAEGRPVTSGAESRPPRRFVAGPRFDGTVTAAEVDALRADPSRPLVDSRAPERFQGRNETIDPVAGHIPGASNRFYKRNVNADGTFRDPEALRSELAELLGDAAPDRAVVYCGSGVTACHNLLALELAGLPGAMLYPGSWSEWCSDPSRPVATGDE